MEDRKKSFVVALAAMIISLGFVITIMQIFLLPIEEHQREEIIKQACPEGLENCTFTIDPNPFLWVLMGAPSLITFVVVYNWMEQRRLKTWKSYR